MSAPDPRPGADLREAVRRRGSWWQTVKAVAWSFFGVRRSADHAQDVNTLNPLHVVLVGLVLAALFVLGLIALVNWVVGSGAAAGV
ncbi:MAG: DUF2970 domain-containing protein [Caldimonas manganoxidans]|uniref:DUF2970 domain-containing protein n=1 Tax=Caldimonas taiwanensis TaxID=307483 RepID=UPI0009FCE279|nr:DUF2970 domain-containing protein [Caldimonas taiwanensis]MCX7660167.1 DUF2970 domain-containing protein [Caldimonas manganoxidans]GIX23309.1 MAG: hypothetical protein KatS3mg122_0540 [Caldimonas sp.]